jgi:hypothetical protein
MTSSRSDLACRDAERSRTPERSSTGRSKSETRGPKAERNPKSEVRIHSQSVGVAGQRSMPFSDFGFRPSFGFRDSVFGFQGSSLHPPGL